MSYPSVLIIGASGYIGVPLVVEFLRQKASFARIAILTEVSKKEKFANVQEQGLELIFGSFTTPSSFKGMNPPESAPNRDLTKYIGFDTVICLLGNYGMKYQPAIIDAAIEGGIKEFYPSEYGSDFEQGAYQTNRYFKDK